MSVTTEIVDTEWEEDEEIVSEIEDNEANSPRVSLNSVRQTHRPAFRVSCTVASLMAMLDWPAQRNNAIVIRRGTDAKVEPDSRGVPL